MEERRLSEARDRLAATEGEFEQTEKLLAETLAETDQLRRRAAELDACANEMLKRFGQQPSNTGSMVASSRGSNVIVITKSSKHLSGKA
uniref:NUDE_C domain-containing protein n=1 Tax=Macrostomum lignano TaxID=282301 RepID=A0A1I8HER3_9PLAT